MAASVASMKCNEIEGYNEADSAMLNQGHTLITLDTAI